MTLLKIEIIVSIEVRLRPLPHKRLGLFAENDILVS